MAGRSEDPYRSPATLPEPLAIVPVELVYLAAINERRNRALRRMAGWLWLGATLCAVALVLMPHLGAWLAAAFVPFLTWRWLLNRKPERIVLAVRDGWVELASPSGKARFQLARVRQVELDTKTIAKAYADKFVGTAVVSLGVRPAIDVARIVLVLDEDDDETRRVVLGSDYEGISEVTAWLGKLRVFLRKHGWIPIDERDA